MQLKAWRVAKGKTQKWLSEATGIDQALLSKYENGTTPLPRNARKIERATNGEVSLEDWYPQGEE